MSHTTVPITAGSGTGIAVDAIGAENFQRVKSVWGVEGTATNTSASNPLPVAVVTSAVGATTVTENGTITGGQALVSLVASLPHSFNGLHWTRDGATPYPSIDLDETPEQVKATAGVLYGYLFSNTTASPLYLKLWNAPLASVTVGTTVPYITLYLPATQSGHVPFGPTGITFPVGITAGATTGVLHTDTGAPPANAVLFTALYK